MQDLCEFDPKEVNPKVVHVGKVRDVLVPTIDTCSA